MKRHLLIGLALLALGIMGASSKKPASVEPAKPSAKVVDCEGTKKKMCTMEYRPFRCLAKFSNVPGHDAIEVRGGNPCETRVKMDMELCLKGFAGTDRHDMEQDGRLAITCTPQ